MALYNLIDVLDTVSSIINDGFTYADITELHEDEQKQTSLYFSAPNPEDPLWSIDYEGVDSLPDEHDITGCSIPTNKAFYGLSLQELCTVNHALTNALEYFKECSADKSYSSEIHDDIKKASVNCRNLQAKIKKILDNYL